MKKRFTIVALCQCGCETARCFRDRASSSQQAVRSFKLKLDPEWPMKPLLVLKGWQYPVMNPAELVASMHPKKK